MITRGVRKTAKRQEGQVLVLMVLLLAALAGFVALAIDMGMLFQGKRELQNAADAAALAAAAYLPGDPARAEAAAREWAAKNGLDPSEIEAVELGDGATRVRVVTRRDVPALFSRALGFLNFETKAVAVARVGSLNGNNQMMPWGLLRGDSNCLDSQGNAIFGQDCVIKVGAQGAIQGWRGALDYDGTGSSDPGEYIDDIIYSTTQTTYCIEGATSPLCQSSTVNVRTGNLVGQTRQGLEGRLAREPLCDRNGNGIDDFPEVFALNPTGNPSYSVICPSSPRLIILPIVSYDAEPVQEVHIEGWALAYLKGFTCGSGNCQGNGRWDVSITIVNGSFSQLPGFITDYDPNATIVLRRLVE